MSKLIALRLPDDLLDRIAVITGSRSAVIRGILEASLIRGHGVPVTDAELVARSENDRSRSDDKSVRGVKGSDPARPVATKSCPSCGALTGHQKWCKA